VETLIHAPTASLADTATVSLASRWRNLALLATVPSASRADNAAALGGSPASCYVKAGLEPVHVVGEPGEPLFENEASNQIGPDFVKVGFYKDLSGIVHLQGYLHLSHEDTSAFTLPPGFRPRMSELFNGTTAPGEQGELRINSNGKVEPIHFFKATLGSVMFRTD
jgi:hypothetical protein